MCLTALIVTDRPDFYQVCEGVMNANNAYAQLSSLCTQEYRRKLEMLQPDILLMDARVNEYAMELVEQFTENPMPRKPALILYLKERLPNWEKFFLRKGVMYIFDNSMRERDLIESIIHLYMLHRSYEREDEMIPELTRVLRECCISPHNRGYACICESVRLILNNPGCAQSLTKKIYPQIAITNRTTAPRVEKNIRDSIRNAWENGGSQVMPAYLGYTQEKPPTNGKFITAVCEKLRESLAQKERDRSLYQY